MSNTTRIDTSREAIESNICNPIISYVAHGRMLSEDQLAHIIALVRTMSDERDALQTKVSTLSKCNSMYQVQEGEL